MSTSPGQNIETVRAEAAGEMTSQGAMVAMGFCGETVTIAVADNMMAAAEMLRRRLTAARYNALFGAIVHIESMELTYADFGVVVADPVAREGGPNGGGPHPMWRHLERVRARLAPLLHPPHSEQEYRRLAHARNPLLLLHTGNDGAHPLAPLLAEVYEYIEQYEDSHLAPRIPLPGEGVIPRDSAASHELPPLLGDDEVANA